MPRLFGEKLRFLRHRNGITQVDLAHRVSLASYTHITKIEANQDAPSLNLVVRIAQLFGVVTDYLLRDSIPVGQIRSAAVVNEVDAGLSTGLFGAKLRALRHQRRLTQIELMRQLGLAGQGYISNLEAGRKAPSLELVVQIADLFGVSTDYLLLDTTAVPNSET